MKYYAKGYEKQGLGRVFEFLLERLMFLLFAAVIVLCFFGVYEMVRDYPKLISLPAAALVHTAPASQTEPPNR